MRDPQRRFAPALADASSEAESSQERIVNATVEILSHVLDTLPESMMGWHFSEFTPMRLRLIRAGGSRALLETREEEMIFCPSIDDADNSAYDVPNPEDWARMAQAFTKHDLLGFIERDLLHHARSLADLAKEIEALLV